MNFNVSIKINSDDITEDERSVSVQFIYSLIADFVKLNKVPLNIENTHLINVFGSGEGIFYILANRFVNDAFRSVLRWLCSLKVVQNPLGIYQIMFPGVIGKLLNPFGDLLKGSSEDSDSMMRRAAIGMFNSIYKVSDTMASGLSKITLVIIIKIISFPYIKRMKKIKRKGK